MIIEVYSLWKSKVDRQAALTQRSSEKLLRLFHKRKGCALSYFSGVQLFATPWTVAHHALLSVGFCKVVTGDAATWCEELTHLKRPWCWERLKVKGEGDDRGWIDWMASPTQWTWVWVNSGSWWWTGRPGVLQSIGSQRVGHDWVTELNWTGDEWLMTCQSGVLSIHSFFEGNK